MSLTHPTTPPELFGHKTIETVSTYAKESLLVILEYSTEMKHFKGCALKTFVRT